MSVLARELNNLLSTSWTTESYNYAAYHFASNENEYWVEIPLVGVARENLSVDVQDGILTIVAKTESKSRFTRNFNQSWHLTKDCNVEAVSAKLENGLLTVRIPRSKPPKKIVNVEIV